LFKRLQAYFSVETMNYRKLDSPPIYWQA